MRFSMIRKTVLGVGAAIMMLGAMAIGADAASYVDGTYNATVNFYVPKSDAPQGLTNAYLTDTAVPPTHANTGTTKVTISNGVITFDEDLAINNSALGLKELGSYDQSIVRSCTLGGAEDVDCDNHDGTRYTTFKATIQPSTVDTTVTYTFTGCKLHAKIQKTVLGAFTITAYDNNFTAPVILNIVLPGEAVA